MPEVGVYVAEIAPPITLKLMLSYEFNHWYVIVPDADPVNPTNGIGISPEQIVALAVVGCAGGAIIFSKNVNEAVVLHPPGVVIITEATCRFAIEPAAKVNDGVIEAPPDTLIPCTLNSKVELATLELAVKIISSPVQKVSAGLSLTNDTVGAAPSTIVITSEKLEQPPLA
jgi:hypothetical protein